MSQYIDPVIAVPIDPSMKITIPMTYIFRLPNMSDNLPMTGMTATYPSKYPVIVQETLFSSVTPTLRSVIILGIIVTTTVWSSAAKKTPAIIANIAKCWRLLLRDVFNDYLMSGVAISITSSILDISKTLIISFGSVSLIFPAISALAITED